MPAKERAARGRNEVFSNALLSALLLAGIAALWSSLRISFANDAMVHIIPCRGSDRCRDYFQ